MLKTFILTMIALAVPLFFIAIYISSTLAKRRDQRRKEGKDGARCWD